MKNLIAFTSLSLALSAPLAAQLTPLPPAATLDGISIQPSAAHVNTPVWHASTLADYRVADDHSFHTPEAGQADAFGRMWSNQAPDRTTLNNKGGTLRLIFLGPASGSPQGAAGYTYSGQPQTQSYTLTTAPGALAFGDHCDIPLGGGQGALFDFWFSTSRATYTLFDSSFSLSDATAGTVRWTAAPFLISTYLDALSTFADIETWVVSIQEVDGTRAGPAHSYQMAAQFFYFEAGAFAPAPGSAVPEPSTYGLFAALALGALAAWRRRRQNADR